jgi:hypothetical protein
MRSRRYVISLLGATAVVAGGAGVAGAATGSKTTTPSRSAAPRAHARRYAPNTASGKGNCPNMDSASGSSSGTAGPPAPSYGGSI